MIFSYSPCPYLEGVKDALCLKFRRFTIGQNCSAVCTNKGGHRDAFSNERCEVLRVLRGLLSVHAHCILLTIIIPAREMILFKFSLSM